MSTDNQQSKEVLEGEVSNEILAQLDILKKSLKENDQLAEEFALNTCSDELKELDEEILKVERFLHEQKSNVKRERMKNNLISQNLVRDSRMGSQILRRHEMLTKNPQYGRKQATDYMHEIATEHEKSLSDYRTMVNKLEKMLNKLTESSDEHSNVISQKELFAHIQRFDEIFGEVAKQVYAVNEESEKLKDLYIEDHKRIYGRFATNPFENDKLKKRNIDAFSNLKGLDAFPSQNSILSISEYLTKQNLQPTTAPSFGSTLGTGLGMTGGGFFGSAKPQTSAFPLSQPSFGLTSQPGPQTSNTLSFGAKPAFGTAISSAAPAQGASLFGATTATPSTGTLFGGNPTSTGPTSTSLFGTNNTTTSTSAPGTAPTAFGSTLSSAASGTLFQGSALASTGFQTPSKPLFGK